MFVWYYSDWLGFVFVAVLGGPYLFSNERERKKGYGSEWMRSEEDQEEAEGREIIIRLYCMKKIIFNIIIIMQKYNTSLCN